ncbi:penicillin-binding transpeptidase domain-containing protein, partial [Psychrobacter sp. T6-1]
APRILKPQVAFEMADILRDVVQRGTAVRARALGRDDIGGKTGTTNEAKDAWFAGFHPTNATVVWMGFDQPATMGRREYGGVAALPVWMDFMKAQLKDTPKQWVSINNRAKSERQQQKVIKMTDDGLVLDEDADDIAKDTARAKPVKPNVQPRQPLEPEPVEEDAATTQSTNNSRSAIQNTPLAPTPAERMPPMPE